MYAIVEMVGQQFKVAKDQKVFVHRLAGEEGDSITFDNVLLTANGEDVTVGAPAIEGAQVGAKISRHLKGDKVIVFKKKRRKGYRVKNGHRQYLTEIVIESITSSGAKPAKKAAAKKEVTATKPESKKSTSKKGDDLKKIEGIGPKAAEALVNAGIDTFAKLAKAEPTNIKEILTTASSRLAHLEPGTWPQQSQLAADGNWDELKVLQDKLDGGK